MSGPSRFRRETVECAFEGMCASCCAWIARGANMVMVTPVDVVLGYEGDTIETEIGLSMGCCSDDCADTFEVEESLNAGSATL